MLPTVGGIPELVDWTAGVGHRDWLEAGRRDWLEVGPRDWLEADHKQLVEAGHTELRYLGVEPDRIAAPASGQLVVVRRGLAVEAEA